MLKELTHFCMSCFLHIPKHPTDSRTAKSYSFVSIFTDFILFWAYILSAFPAYQFPDIVSKKKWSIRSNLSEKTRNLISLADIVLQIQIWKCIRKEKYSTRVIIKEKPHSSKTVMKPARKMRPKYRFTGRDFNEKIIAKWILQLALTPWGSPDKSVNNFSTCSQKYLHCC